MSWERVLQDDLGAGEHLVRQIDALFEQQRATWQALRDGEQALKHIRSKTLTCDGAEIVVQLNPGRQRSTRAKVDAQSVASRPCFLCPENMPPEERGIAVGNLVILPNPYPVLPWHCTVADREHRPQKIAGRVASLLSLAAAIGPDLAAFYNGPRCGASAPDHFHFQACSAAQIPLLAQLPLRLEDRQRTIVETFERTMLVFASANAADVQADIERAHETFRQLEKLDDEPMFNLLTHFDGGRLVAVLFPRKAHRPQCYYAIGPDHLAVSPAALEMAGVLVVTEPDEFARVDAKIARSVYAEVSLDRAHCEQLISSIRQRSR